MSAVIEIFISCDGCGENFGVDIRNNTTVAKQREKAKLNDWKFIKGKDYCPACAKKQQKR